MKGKHKLLSLVLTALLSFGIVTPHVVHAAPVSNTISIIHTNDVHGRLDGDYAFARFKAFLDQKQPLLLLDGGDRFQGLPISNVTYGADMAELTQLLNYDAVAVGNHEFDFGLDVALGKVDGFGKSLGTLPLLSANTVYKADKSLVFQPSTLVQKDGYTIPIIGVTTPETEAKTHPNNVKDVEWLDPFTSVKSQIMLEEYADADFYVVVAHLGVDSETVEPYRGSTLAKLLSEDEETKDKRIVIIDGHSHTSMDDRYGNVLLAQTGEYFSNIGEIEINMTDWTHTSQRIKTAVALEDFPLDSPSVVNNQTAQEIIKVVDRAKKNFKEISSAVVFENFEYTLSGDREIVRRQQAPLGTLISDALVSYAKSGNHPVDFAVTNGGGIRADLTKGNITVGDLIAILPFGNIYSSIEVKGSDVLLMFEKSFSNDYDFELEKFSASGGHLQVSSNVTVVLSGLEQPYKRIRDVQFVDNEGTLQTIVPNQTYRIATNDFLAMGGDDYSMLGGPRIEGESLDVVLTQYFEKADFTNPIYTSLTEQARIVRVKTHKLFDESLAEEIAYFDDAELNAASYTKDSFSLYLEAVEFGRDLLTTLNSLPVATARVAITDATTIDQATLDQASADIKASRAALVKSEPSTPDTDKETVIDNGEETEETLAGEKVNTPTLPETGVSNIHYAYLVAAGAMLLTMKKRKTQ